jgi:hypothetical protein
MKRPKVESYETTEGNKVVSVDYVNFSLRLEIYADYQDKQIAELKWLVNDLQSRLSEVEPPF